MAHSVDRLNGVRKSKPLGMPLQRAPIDLVLERKMRAGRWIKLAGRRAGLQDKEAAAIAGLDQADYANLDTPKTRVPRWFADLYANDTFREGLLESGAMEPGDAVELDAVITIRRKARSA